MVGHDDEGVEFVGALGAVVLEGLEEEFGVGWELEEAASVVGDGGDEEGAGLRGSWRDGHAEIVGGARVSLVAKVLRCGVVSFDLGMTVSSWGLNGRARVYACHNLRHIARL